MPETLIDMDTLSEVLKGRNPNVHTRALSYLAAHGRFTFSIITRYEILRGLMAKQAVRRIEAFEQRCGASRILPLSDEVAVRAADIYADLYRRGELISDADILIAATAMAHGMNLVTENVADFGRVTGLAIESWRQA